MIPRLMTFEQLEAAILDGRLSVSGGKGDNRAKSAEANALSFQSSLMNVFKQQFGAQSQILNFIAGKMTSQVNNPQGFTPEATAAMNTQATEGVAREFNQANTAAKEMEAQQGGNGLPSGVQAQITAGNANEAAQTQAAAQNQIRLANAEQQQQNYWNAVKVLGGTAETINPTSYAGQATGAGNSVADLSKAYSDSQQSGFFNTLANGFASSLGKGIGGFATGGLSTLSGMKPTNG